MTSIDLTLDPLKSVARRERGTIEEFKIIQSVLQGDREAYAELVRHHHPRIIGLCYSMLLNKSEAEDAAQEVFMKAFVSLRKYTRDLSFSAWLYRIASNHCLDLLRKRKRQKTDSLDGLIEQRGEGVESSAFAVPPSAQERVDSDDKVQLALRALSYLPIEQRQILMLREVDGLSYEEICSALKCSLDAVKARLRRARLKLQDEARHFLKERSFK